MKNNAIYIVLCIYAGIAILTIILFNGTGDAGDSIMHYLFAKFAPDHPVLFFDHWAKPVYVLMVSPFAQSGFIGVKIFNAIVVLLTIFFTYKIAIQLNIKNAIMSAVFLIFSPLYFVLTFSGLTEPLFALFLSIALFAILKKKYITTIILVSFLPFIRSEGLILIGVFGLYLLFKRKWKLLPLLLFGHIVYTIIGYFFYHDILWTINKIPYANLNSVYGSGNLFHFIEHLIYVIGLPIYILFWIGVLTLIWNTINKKTNFELQILVLLGFFAFLIAHSLFWYLGIFNSMGLTRVMIAVIPLISIISLFGFNFITEDLIGNKKKVKLVVQGFLIAYILIFPFTNNPAAINWEKDLNLSIEQQTAHQVGDYIDKHIGGDHRFIYTHPYLSQVLDIDHFDNNKHLELTQGYFNHTKAGDIIIWENWLSVVERDIKKEYLDSNTELTNIYNVSANDNRRIILYSVYERK